MNVASCKAASAFIARRCDADEVKDGITISVNTIPAPRLVNKVLKGVIYLLYYVLISDRTEGVKSQNNDLLSSRDVRVDC